MIVTLVAVRDSKIIEDLYCRLIVADAKQTGNIIDCITISSTSKTMEPMIQFHTGMFVRMKRTACHSVPCYFKAVMLRSCPCRYMFIYQFKHIHAFLLSALKASAGPQCFIF